MPQSTPFIVIVAALLINTLSYCSAESVYCVTPTATSCSSCPQNSANCTTLSEYAQEAELYFTSNTTVVFLPGEHVLDTNITVANVTRLTMWGESSSDNMATVVRSGSVGFTFTNMVDFNIYCLAFTYSRSWSCGSHPVSNTALLLQSTQYTKLVHCSFHDNLGNGLTVNNSNITLVENEYTHNQCGCVLRRCKLGCGITAHNSTLIFTGNTTFLKNTRNNFGVLYQVGAAAILAVASSLYFTGTNNFVDNVNSATDSYGRTMGSGGAICITNNALLALHGKNNFINNSAGYGGAIYTFSHTNVTFNGTNMFISNSAVYGGGAISAKRKISLTFIGTSNFSNNSAGMSGGAISVVAKVVLTFNGVNSFINNSAERSDGGAIRAVYDAVVTFNKINKFIGNSAYSNGGAIFAFVNILSIFTGSSSFSSNSAMQGGAISAHRNSTLTFNESISFINNGHYVNKFKIGSGNSYGGALYLFIKSTFSILPNTTVSWESNHASLGGAICVSDVNTLVYCTQAIYIPREECFFQLPGQNLSSGLNIQLIFKNNSADDAGSVLYGGAIDDKCKLTGLNTYKSGKVFDMLLHNSDGNYRTISKISSDPFHICRCKNNVPDCSRSQYFIPRSVYPGETFQISLIAVGQRKGTVSSIVRSTVKTDSITDSHSVNLLDYQYLQQAHNACTKLNYTVISLSWKVQIQLHPEGSPCLRGSWIFWVKLNLNQTCPPGFNISESARSCVCEPRLAQYTNQCNITNGVGRITRESNKHFWVGYEHSSHELILHPHCPFDYCVNHNTVVFPLNNTDMQCAYNRSGLLCGRCKEGYSLLLGTSQCKKCTNKHSTLLIPFAMMGVALVFLLFVCKLTVATGTLSGLILYANIVGVNRTIFLPARSTDAISIFIAWLNLDFGIETCFYDGMDAYSKMWLQFMFPVYIWVLVGLMILVGHFSQRFVKLLGSNPVSVLATLILLSYTKILRTLITTVYSTYLEYPTYNRRVWLYDANIDYVSGKHIPLFLVAVLVFFFLFLPYTLLLLFGQWLQAVSHLRLFSWVNSARLKPFMDSYHAPYKAKHRYWPGLLLVLRFVLLLVFALNPQQDPNINLLAILVGAGILHLWAWVSGGVYKNWCLDALEGSFVLNLITLVGTTYYVKLTGGNQLAVGYTSVSIALATFIVILVYHIFQQLRHTKLWKKVPKLKLKFKKLNTKQAVNNLNNPNDSTESANFDQLREPWLEDLLQPTHSSI